MAWVTWPFTPNSLSECFSGREDVDRQKLVSLLISGCSESLGRAITIIERSNPRSVDTVPKYHRIDSINTRQNCTPFCHCFRSFDATDAICRDQDLKFAAIGFEHFGASKEEFLKLECHAQLLDFACPIFVANELAGIALSGQFLPVAGHSQILTYGKRMLRQLGDPNSELGAELESAILDSESLGDEAEFGTRFSETVGMIGRIATSEWKSEKGERERRMLGRIASELQSCSIARTRADVQAVCGRILNLVSDFTGSASVGVFCSEAELVSLRSNANLLPMFACAFKPNHFTSHPDCHFNWNKSGLEPPQDMNSGPMLGKPSRDLELLLQHESIAERSVVRGIRGADASLFSECVAAVPVALSRRYRSILVFGPFTALESSRISLESGFLIDIARLLLGWLLNNLAAIDSEASSRTWTDTAGMLAHNARRATTPLQASTDILKMYVQGDKRYDREKAETAIAQLRAVEAHLVAQLRLPIEAIVARAEDAFTFSTQVLADIVEECIKFASPTAELRGVSIVMTNNVQKLGLFIADRSKYAIALGHLIDNAIKYSHPNKVVMLDASTTQDGFVDVTVDDFGAGISAADYERIYQPRVRGGLQSRRASQEFGEGWGLYHASQIARAHGGNISHVCITGERRSTSSTLSGYRVVFTLRTLREA